MIKPVMINPDKIKKSIGEIIFNHINSLNEDQLNTMTGECEIELMTEWTKNGTTERYSRLYNELQFLNYRLNKN